MQVGIHACGDEDVALAAEMSRHPLDLVRLVARKVEYDVGLGLRQGPLELRLVRAVEGDIAGEGPERSLLAPGCDRLHSAAHQLLARGDADEAATPDDERAGHSMSRVTKSTSMPSSSLSRSASSFASTTERWRPPLQPKATTTCIMPFCSYSGTRSRTMRCTSSRSRPASGCFITYSATSGSRPESGRSSGTQ